jgi:hypothetical protein
MSVRTHGIPLAEVQGWTLAGLGSASKKKGDFWANVSKRRITPLVVQHFLIGGGKWKDDPSWPYECTRQSVTTMLQQLSKVPESCSTERLLVLMMTRKIDKAWGDSVDEPYDFAELATSGEVISQRRFKSMSLYHLLVLARAILTRYLERRKKVPTSIENVDDLVFGVVGHLMFFASSRGLNEESAALLNMLRRMYDVDGLEDTFRISDSRARVAFFRETVTLIGLYDKVV